MSDRSQRDHSMIHVSLPRRTLQLCADKLPPNAVVLLVAPETLAPEFFRLQDTCPETGMGRTWVLDRVRLSQGTPWPVKACHIRERGNTRGVVLIDRASYLEYLHHQPPPPWIEEELQRLRTVALQEGMGGDGI